MGYVMTLKTAHSWWHLPGTPGALWELAQAAPRGSQVPGAWQRVVRYFRDGHQETWWALEAVGGPFGPDKTERLVMVTTVPAALPDETPWYLG